MKYIKEFKNYHQIKESVGEDYLEELYDRGAISTDVYDLIKFEEDLSSFETKKDLLHHLNNVGGISSDVYDMELSQLD